MQSFLELMNDRRGMIKSALMDQQLMAGIGNVCSDEILFQSRVHPKKKVQDLSEDDLRNIYKQMKQVVHTKLDSLDHHKELPDSFMIKDRSEGADCPNGKGTIKKIKVGGRYGYYCPRCQHK